MFMKSELESMKKGVELKIKQLQDLYLEKVLKLEVEGWEINPANTRSLAKINVKISELKELCKKISEEIKKA